MRRAHGRRLAAMLAAGSTVLAVGACGGDEPTDDGSGSASADAGRQLTEDDAEQALPIVAQLPEGLSVNPEPPAEPDPQQSSYPSQCMDVKLDGSARTALDDLRVARATRGYDVTGGGYLSATITSYSSEVPAVLFDDAGDAIGACSTFELSDKEGRSSWRMTPLAVDNAGDRTLALDLTSTTKKDEFEGGTVEFLAVADGHTLVTVIYSVTDPTQRRDLLSDKLLRATLANLAES